MHLSSDSYVDVDACRMWYYEMWFYDCTCDGGRILGKTLKVALNLSGLASLEAFFVFSGFDVYAGLASFASSGFDAYASLEASFAFSGFDAYASLEASFAFSSFDAYISKLLSNLPCN